MKSDRNLRSSFKQLDAPGTPDPEYAATLRSQFVREARVDATSSIAAVASPQRKPAPLPKRRRWFDLAAAAVLLLSMIGGIARVSTSSEPTPTIPAPLTQQPAIMQGGTAAQDNQYPGPAPSAIDYSLQFTLDSAHGGLAWPVIAQGEVLYGFSLGSMGYIKALSALTGETVWSQPATLDIRFAVTSMGVIVGVPVASHATPASTGDSPRFQVALLNLDSGDLIWRSRQTYSGNLNRGSLSVLTDGNEAFFTDENGLFVALDLATGEERWRHSYNRTLPEGIEARICTEQTETAPTSCIPRDAYPINVAIKDSTLYFSDIVTAAVSAISIRDGTLIWTVPMTDRAGGNATLHGAMMAVEGGIVIQLLTPGTLEIGADNYLGMWSESTGAEVWSTTAFQTNGMTTDGAALFANHASPEESCCVIAKLDLRTGEEISSSYLPGGVLVYGYLPAENSIIVLDADPPAKDWAPVNWVKWMAVDATTLEQTWQFEPPHSSCLLSLPLTKSGKLICTDFENVMKIFAPAADQ